MWLLVRALTYASLFIGFVLVFVPARVLSWYGFSAARATGAWPVAGVIVTVLGGALAVWCVVAFAVVGGGTPAPFDPPLRLVTRGPYRFVRNPMYVGATLALAGAAIAYRSLPLIGYAALFGVIAHLLVVSYEEPKLRRRFGIEYEEYCALVGRWWPKR